jgi:DNA modification methylase
MAAWEMIEGNSLAVLPGMADESVDCILTDPPYGINFQSYWKGKAKRFDKIAGDARPFVWWLHDAARVLRDGGCLLCFCRWDVQEAFRAAIGWAGLDVRSQVIWDREAHGMGDLTGQFGPRHDVIWFAAKGSYSFPADRPQSVIRSVRRQGDALVHPNEKPLDLMRQLVRAVSRDGELILDPFAGSASTGIAALQTGRRFLGIEIDPTYAALCRDRLAEAHMGGPLCAVGDYPLFQKAL